LLVALCLTSSGMMIAVYFNNKAAFEAKEIGYETCDGMLPAEFKATKSSVT
jgi:hypothetical protein